MRKVCFATPGALAMLQHGDGAVYGGSELRALRFARGLAAHGFDVSMIAPSSAAQASAVSGMKLVRGDAGSWSSILQRLRLRHHSPERAWQAADAGLYVSFGACDYSAMLAEWCHSFGRSMLLCSGSDADFSEDLRPGNMQTNLWGSRCDRCYDSMTKASVVTVQSDTQRRLLRERYRRDGPVIRNPAPFVPRSGPVRGGKYLLWVGKAVSNKHPELAIELARLCPDVRMRMIVNKVTEEDYRRLSADKPSNVDIVQSVAHGDMMREYENAFAFLSTSAVEGFPNTFLEACAFGLPIFSLHVDPDGMIARENAGVVSGGDLNSLAAEIRRFHGDPDLSARVGARGLAYVKTAHEPEGRLAEFAQLAGDILAGRAPADYRFRPLN